MTHEYLALDPALPICWETTEILRIGFERAEVRVRSPSPAEQRFIGQLRLGVRRSDLEAVARRTGLLPPEHEALLRELAPALVSKNPSAPISHDLAAAPAITVRGDGSFAEAMRTHLKLARVPSAAHDAPPDLVILVEQFLGPTARGQSLLSDGIPHLPVRLTDRHLYVGPFVPPGGSPCLSCVELHTLDIDPVLQILAAQLANGAPAAATDTCAWFASTLAVATAIQYRASTHRMVDLVGVRLRYPVHDRILAPVPTVEHIPSHVDCGCVTLARSASESSRTEAEPGLLDEARGQALRTSRAGSSRDTQRVPRAREGDVREPSFLIDG